MKIIVCGGREYTDYARLVQELDTIVADRSNLLLIHGAARGADSLAAKWAESRHVRAQAFPAKWDLHGRKAGSIRNHLMLIQKPDLVIAFPGGRGTAHMVRIAKAAGIPVVEVQP